MALSPWLAPAVSLLAGLGCPGSKSCRILLCAGSGLDRGDALAGRKPWHLQAGLHLSRIAAMRIETAIELRDLEQKLQTALGTQMPETLYHYTDAAGLLGIVTSGTVWATHSAYLNDASEFQYAVGLTKAVIEKATADAKPDSWEALCRDASIEWEVESQYSGGSAQVPDEQHFVACFSKAGDGLSQWRGYGKSIGGYALGFPSEHLRAIANRISQAGKKSNPQITVGFGSCWYNPKKQKALLKEAFDGVLRHLEKLGPPDTSFDPDPIMRLRKPNYWLPRLLKRIPRAVSPYFKDPAFERELEWRLVVKVRRSKSRPDEYGHDPEQTQDDTRLNEVATVRFRKAEYSLVPDLELPVVLNAELSLSHLVVGPTPLPENALAAAVQLLGAEPKASRTSIAAPARRRIVCTNIDNSRIPFRRV